MKKTLGNFKILSVSDGDTIGVDRAPMPDVSGRKTLRLLHLDTEETESPKELGPVTTFGKEVKELASRWFAGRGNDVELKGDGEGLCDDYFHRPLVQVFSGGECYQEHAVASGWSPYFMKYGYSCEYHEILVEAAAKARKDKAGIWSPALQGRPEREARPYQLLEKWWRLRADQIRRADAVSQENFCNLVNGKDYAKAMLKAAAGEEVQAFGEIARPPGSGKAGRGLFIIRVKLDAPFYVYVAPDAPQREKIIGYVETQFISNLKHLPESLLKGNFAFIRGRLALFSQNRHDIPSITVTHAGQISKEPMENI